MVEHGRRPAGPFAHHPGYRGSDEGRCREDRARPRRAHGSLRLQVHAQAHAVADGAACGEREKRRGARPSLSGCARERERERKREKQ